MKYFKTIHISKKIIGMMILGVVLIGTAVVSFPPAVARVSAIVAEKTERKLPIYCVQTEEPKVSVSFDAAWGADDTDELLRILEENKVKATFFLCGYWVEKYPEEVKKIAEAGHDLGNHSATHPHMSQLTAEQITEELQKCHQNVKELTGIEMELFRSPFGEYDNEVIETATANGYHTIQWDIETPAIKIKAVRALEKSRFVTTFFYFQSMLMPFSERKTTLIIVRATHLFSSMDVTSQSAAEKG